MQLLVFIIQLYILGNEQIDKIKIPCLAKKGADSQRSAIDSNFSLKCNSNINNNNSHRGSLSSNGSFGGGSSRDIPSNPNSRNGSRRNLISCIQIKGSADSAYTNVRPRSTSARFSRKNGKQPPIAVPSKATVNFNNALSNVNQNINDRIYAFTSLISTQASVDGDVSPVPIIRNHRVELSSTPRIIVEHDVLSAQSSVRSDSAGSHRDLLVIETFLKQMRIFIIIEKN